MPGLYEGIGFLLVLILILILYVYWLVSAIREKSYSKLVVLVLIPVVLFSMFVYLAHNFMNAKGTALMAADESNLINIGKAINQYRQDTSAFPANLKMLVPRYLPYILKCSSSSEYPKYRLLGENDFIIECVPGPNGYERYPKFERMYYSNAEKLKVIKNP